MVKARWGLLVAILVLPTAAAVSHGSFLVEGRTDLPEGAGVAFAPHLVFARDATRLQDFRLLAPRVTLHEFRWDNVDSGQGEARVVVPGSARNESRVLQDVEITFADVSGPGHLGIYPDRAARASLQAFAGAIVKAQERGEVDTGVTLEDRVGPMLGMSSSPSPLEPTPDYEWRVEEPHIWLEGAGVLDYEGPGFVKIVGPDLLVRAGGLVEEVPTGDVRESAFTGSHRWVVLELDPGTLMRVASLDAWALAGRDLSARWDGESVFTPSLGALETSEGRYVPSHGEVRLTGRFDAEMTPARMGDRVMMRMVLTGEMEGTTLRLHAAVRAPADAGAASGWSPGLLLLGVAACVGAAGYGAHAWVRRARRAEARAEPPRTVEECVAAATAAADDEDWPRAVDWLRRVRRMAPTSARACADLAHALCQMGRVEEGLRAYEEASRLAQDGEADFNGAVVAVEAGRPADEVERWLERALQRTPVYVIDVESDPAFHRLRGRERFDRMVADAWLRVDDADLPFGA